MPSRTETAVRETARSKERAVRKKKEAAAGGSGQRSGSPTEEEGHRTPERYREDRVVDSDGDDPRKLPLVKYKEDGHPKKKKA